MSNADADFQFSFLKCSEKSLSFNRKFRDISV